MPSQQDIEEMIESYTTTEAELIRELLEDDDYDDNDELDNDS